MKIFLIYPIDSRYHRTTCPPLGLAYLASALVNNGHVAKITDRNIIFAKERNNLYACDKITLKEISDFAPDVIVFSSTITTISDANYFSGIIKNTLPGKITILSGPYPYVFRSFNPEYDLELCPQIDIVIHGEGEQIIVNLTKNLNNLAAVKGISFRKANKVISNGEATQTHNLDDIPMPRRDLLDMEFYSSAGFDAGLYGRATTILSSRGCYHNCKYCLSSCANPLFRGTFRFHSAERILSEIENILSLCKIDCLYFYDDDFLADKNRVIELCEILIKNKIYKRIKWIAQTRAETSRIDRQTLRLIKKAGCMQLEFGFESGSQEELDRMNKKTRVGEYLITSRLVKKSGLRIQGDFIMGYPGQTINDFRQTIALIKKMKPTYITSLQYMHLPGTSVYSDLENEDFPGKFGDLGQKQNFTEMSDEEYKEMHSKILVPLKIKSNRKNFILYYLLNKPLLLCYLMLKYAFKQISDSFNKLQPVSEK